MFRIFINKLFTVTSFMVLLGLSGCAHYRTQSLRRLGRGIDYQTKEQFISLDYQVFNAVDCRTYLDRNVLAKRYQPIQITVTNNSKRCFGFSLADFSLPCESAETIAKAVHTSTVGRAVGYGIASLFLWPFIIPAIVDGCGSASSNEELDADFMQKSLHDRVIHPYSIINGILFVASANFSEDFTLTLIDQNNELQNDNKQFVLSSSKPRLNV